MNRGAGAWPGDDVLVEVTDLLELESPLEQG
jgi:hypothetical protein